MKKINLMLWGMILVISLMGIAYAQPPGGGDQTLFPNAGQVPANAAGNQGSGVLGCCERPTDGSWCGFVDQSQCSNEFHQGVPCTSLPNKCQTVCCASPDGTCSSNKARTECEASGGNAVGVGSCSNVASCGFGGCIIEGVCQRITTSAGCRALGVQGGYQSTFNPSLTSCDAYNRQQGVGGPGLSGCCVFENTGKTCKEGDQTNCPPGKFHPGKSCDSFSGDLCSGCTSVNVCGDDGNIHSQSSCSPTKTLVEDCVSKGEICGVNNRGNLDCVDTICKVGTTALYDMYEPFNGVVEPRTIKLTKELLGLVTNNKDHRKDGESWCVATGFFRSNPQSKNEWYAFDAGLKDYKAGAGNPENEGRDYRDYSAGSRHYVYKCEGGRVKVEDACDIFRSEVCIENTEPWFHVIDLNPKVFFSNWLRPDNDVHGEDVEKFLRSNQAYALADRAKREGSKARCILNELDEGAAIYPKGNLFYTNSFYQNAPTPICSEACGVGRFNPCGHDECSRLGDCKHSRGFNAGAGLSLAWKVEAAYFGITRATSVITGKNIRPGGGKNFKFLDFWNKPKKKGDGKSSKGDVKSPKSKIPDLGTETIPKGELKREGIRQGILTVTDPGTTYGNQYRIREGPNTNSDVVGHINFNENSAARNLNVQTVEGNSNWVEITDGDYKDKYIYKGANTNLVIPEDE
jgi:hypothetical protein